MVEACVEGMSRWAAGRGLIGENNTENVSLHLKTLYSSLLVYVLLLSILPSIHYLEVAAQQVIFTLKWSVGTSGKSSNRDTQRSSQAMTREKCQNRAVEKCVKRVTEASKHVFVIQAWDGCIDLDYWRGSSIHFLKPNPISKQCNCVFFLAPQCGIPFTSCHIDQGLRRF